MAVGSLIRIWNLFISVFIPRSKCEHIPGYIQKITNKENPNHGMYSIFEWSATSKEIEMCITYISR